MSHFNSSKLGYKPSPPLKCSVCNKKDNTVQKFIHLPLPDGRYGHISLQEWTNYCPDCMKEEARQVNEAIEKAKAR